MSLGKRQVYRTDAVVAQLWRDWTTGGDLAARNRLVLTYAPLVKYLAARKVRDLPAHCELEDLISCGLVALIGACDRWDPARGTTFEQYAWARIEGAILDELRRLDWAPRSLRHRAKVIAKARDRCQTRSGREPSEVELAREVGEAVVDLRRDLADIDRVAMVSLDAVAPDSDDSGAHTSLGSRLATDAPSPEAAVMAGERSRQFRCALGRLTPRERLVVELIDGQGLRGALVGEHLGISESRVSQIHATARTRLQRALARHDPGDTTSLAA